MKIHIFLTTILISALLVSCGKKCKDINSSHEFALPVSIGPMADTIHIGDTLWVSSVFSEYVYDRNNDKSFLFSNDEDFSTDFIFDIVDRSPKEGQANVNSIIYDKDKYDMTFIPISNGSVFVNTNYYKENGLYHLKFGFIAKKVGLHLFGMTRIVHVKGRSVDFPGRCKLADIIYVQEQPEESNFEFFEKVKDEDLQIVKEPGWEWKFFDGAGYCFYVVE